MEFVNALAGKNLCFPFIRLHYRARMHIVFVLAALHGDGHSFIFLIEKQNEIMDMDDQPVSTRTRSKTRRIEIKNCKPGILYQDGKKTIYLGNSGRIYESETITTSAGQTSNYKPMDKDTLRLSLGSKLKKVPRVSPDSLPWGIPE